MQHSIKYEVVLHFRKKRKTVELIMSFEKLQEFKQTLETKLFINVNDELLINKYDISTIDIKMKEKQYGRRRKIY